MSARELEQDDILEVIDATGRRLVFPQGPDGKPIDRGDVVYSSHHDIRHPHIPEVLGSPWRWKGIARSLGWDEEFHLPHGDERERRMSLSGT